MLQSERTHGGIAIDVGMGLAWDYTNSAGKYSIARYSVRPGKYFLTNPATSSTTIITASEKIRLPFEVEAGKTYYLGNFEVYVLSNGKNIFGQTVPWGFIWLADKSAKPNRAAIKSKFPDVDADNMIRLEGNFSAPPYIFNDKSLIPKACLKKSS
ncbi:MAG: hypothetical protein EOO68_00035 [Moraxellaceae bacterium]|nr:MAG: hypothetical protein EOO68_00035 [Moraxellaceae bacterium]